MKTRFALLGLLTTAFSLFGILAAVHAAPQTQTYQVQKIEPLPAASQTHVGVPVDRLVVLQTSQVYSGVPSGLYYDGFFNAPFSVPEGYAFVATDVIVNPLVGTTEPMVYGYMNVDGFLRYPIQHVGKGMSVHGLGTGLVFRPGNDPRVYAYSSSVGTFQVTITGYFVQGNARPAGVPFQG